MNETIITSTAELRSAVAIANSHINAICNSKDIDLICTEFIKLKEVLNAIFRYKVEEVSK